MISITNLTELSKYLDGIKAVIFDLDDTLYQEIEYVKSGYKKIAERFPEIEDMYSKLWEAFLQGKKAIDTVLKAKGFFDESIKEECVSIYRNQIPDIVLSEQVKDLLKLLKDKGFLLGLITDGRPEGQKAKIRALNIEKFFDSIIITDELGGVEYRKPNERAYVLTCERLGVQFQQTVYVGDNIKKDFIAPEKLGMRSIYFKNREGLY